MRISIITFSCCNPAMASEDRTLVRLINNAMAKTGSAAEVSIVPASEAVTTFDEDQMKELAPLFRRYGTSMLPAILIDGRLAMYGGVPTEDKLLEVLQMHLGRNGD